MLNENLGTSIINIRSSSLSLSDIISYRYRFIFKKKLGPTKKFWTLIKKFFSFKRKGFPLSNFYILAREYMLCRVSGITKWRIGYVNKLYGWAAPRLNSQLVNLRLLVQLKTLGPSSHTRCKVHSRQSTLWLNDLCLEIITVHGNDIRLFLVIPSTCTSFFLLNKAFM